MVSFHLIRLDMRDGWKRRKRFQKNFHFFSEKRNSELTVDRFARMNDFGALCKYSLSFCWCSVPLALCLPCFPGLVALCYHSSAARIMEEPLNNALSRFTHIIYSGSWELQQTPILLWTGTAFPIHLTKCYRIPSRGPRGERVRLWDNLSLSRGSATSKIFHILHCTLE